MKNTGRGNGENHRYVVEAIGAGASGGPVSDDTWVVRTQVFEAVVEYHVDLPRLRSRSKWLPLRESDGGAHCYLAVHRDGFGRARYGDHKGKQGHLGPCIGSGCGSGIFVVAQGGRSRGLEPSAMDSSWNNNWSFCSFCLFLCAVRPVEPGIGEKEGAEVGHKAIAYP